MNPFPGKTVIGLTGGIASGKSTALKIFEQLGWETISVDSIVSEFLEKDERVRDTLRKRWGNELFFSGGIVDKSKIAQIIFNDPSERSWLESFLHPLVRSHWVKFIGNSSKERFVVELPLLFENKLKSHFTKILCIYVPMDLQVSRMLERDPMNRKPWPEYKLRCLPLIKFLFRITFCLEADRRNFFAVKSSE